MAYDVAVLLLDKPAKTKPVALAPSNYTLVPVKNGIKGGDWLLVAGWGSTDTGNPAFNLMCASLLLLLGGKAWGWHVGGHKLERGSCHHADPPVAWEHLLTGTRVRTSLQVYKLTIRGQGHLQQYLHQPI